MSDHGDKIVRFRREENASSPVHGLPATRLAVRALLDDATAEVPEPASVRGRQRGRWQRASLIFGLAGGYGLIVTQGWSGDADVVPACLNFGLLAAAVICMVVADRQDHPR